MVTDESTFQLLSVDASQDSEAEREDQGGEGEGRVVRAALGPGRVELSVRKVQRLLSV